MNKQEAIEKIKNIETLNVKDMIASQIVDMVIKNQVLDIVSQIDEPQKAVVPKFVADFYESIKDDFENKVYDLCLKFNRDICELSGEVWEWFDCGENEPIQTLVKMELYGYKIEQEKLYTAKLKSTGEYLHYDTHTCKVHHLFQYDDMAKKSRLYHFNEDELRKYNAWENDVYDVNEVR